jgi:hypothetical protein
MVPLGQHLFPQLLARRELTGQDRLPNRPMNIIAQQHQFALPLCG